MCVAQFYKVRAFQLIEPISNDEKTTHVDIVNDI